MQPDRFLIVNADDFGITQGASRGIVDCHRAGTVTSTTLMVNMPSAGYAMDLTAGCPNLGVGWHANLTLGFPIAAPAQLGSLVRNGHDFHNRGALERRLLFGRVNRKELETELNAQFQRFLDFGKRPTHIDSHQHVHVFPQVFDVLASIAWREKLPIRMPWAWKGESRRTVRRAFRAWGLESMLARNHRQWRGRIRTNTGFCSAFDLTDSAKDLDYPLYRQLLKPYHNGDIVELMVHPAEVDDALRALTRITAFSERERDLLQTAALREIAAADGFRLIHYGEYPGRDSQENRCLAE